MGRKKITVMTIYEQTAAYWPL